MEKLLAFTKFYNAFQKTKRFLYVVGEDRKENDVEHSYQVALTCWYLYDLYKMKLDMEKVLKYSIAHDILEVYTGDFHFNDSVKRINKLELEKEALVKLKSEFPEYKDIFKIIKDYENQKDQESKFVNAVEKLIPLINIYLDEGRLWKEEGMTYDIIEKNKDSKIGISKIPDRLWKEFKPILKESGLLI